MASSELKKLKVTELREKLSSRGLDTKGVKDDLIARLAAAIESDAGGSAEEPPPAVDEVIPRLL
jgi:hypothetical protein